jgi:hypothetical protein
MVNSGFRTRRSAKGELCQERAQGGGEEGRILGPRQQAHAARVVHVDTGCRQPRPAGRPRQRRHVARLPEGQQLHEQAAVEADDLAGRIAALFAQVREEPEACSFGFMGGRDHSAGGAGGQKTSATFPG